MKNISIALVLLLLVSCAASAQKKGWSDWDKKDVEKTLNDSPWGQTQTEGTALTLRVRMFSAKPIREAFARKVLLTNPNLKPAQLENFVNGDYSDTIVVAVSMEISDKKLAGPLVQEFGSASTETLADAVYLEKADGSHIKLSEYAKPATDGTGAKFVFPRTADGKPVLSPDESFKFVASFGKVAKVSRKFKLSEMSVDGKLEY